MPLKVEPIRVLGACAYLIAGKNGMVLVDALFPHMQKLFLEKMRELRSEDLRLIFITHAHIDHYGSASRVREITGAPIAIHAADAETMAMSKTSLGSARSAQGYLLKLFVDINGHPRVLSGSLKPTPADVLLQDGDNLASMDSMHK